MSNATELPPLEALLTAQEVAGLNRRSLRWLKDRMKKEPIEHTLIGNRVYFTRAQVEALRERDRVVPVAAPVTTGRAKKP